MPSSNGKSLITTDLKVKNIILPAILSFYRHSTKILPQKNFPRSITVHFKNMVYMVSVFNISHHHFIPHPLRIVHKLIHQAVEKQSCNICDVQGMAVRRSKEEGPVS